MAENDIMTLDEYVEWPQKFLASEEFFQLEGAEPRGWKFEVGSGLSRAREAVLSSDDSSSIKQVTKEFNKPDAQRLFFFIDGDPLDKWFKEKPDDALQPLKTLWTEDGTPIAERIRTFVEQVPPRGNGFKSAGSRMNVVSVLLMALDPERYPPLKVRFLKEGYKRTGYRTPPKDADAGALYEHALGFLDKLVERAAALCCPKPSNRLEAQSMVWSYQWAKKRFGPRNEGAPVEMVEEEPPSVSPSPSLDELADELMFDVEFLERVEKLLEDKRQVIFQGPPGTGKTYTAKKLAVCLAGSDERVRLVQFHPSYAYEDFVQGFRPKLIDRQPGFELKDGPLLDMAKMAEQDPEQKHFLVIDEINRGNLAKVFGEMYFLLEYRDEEMRLQYSESGETFAMPPNLYIIGTMNTADRSIALVDLALRRRFYFVVFHPDKDPVKGLLRGWLDENNPEMAWAADIVDRANELLADREAAIGPSYLMKEGLDEEKARMIWEHNVLPYVEEHLYGQTDGLAQFDFDSLRGRSDSNGESDEDGGDGEDEESAAGSDDA